MTSYKVSHWSFIALTAALAGCSGTPSNPDSGIPTPDGGQVLPNDSGLPPGIAKTCATGTECPDSGICGGNGLCCEAACNQEDRICGSAACDLHGACLYPDNNTPCGSTCTGGQITNRTCDGNGGCKPQASQPCGAPYGCAVGGTSCATNCIDDTNCAANATCDAEGACVARKGIGFCTSNDQCTSGICDIHGSGACCVKACDTRDAICGATACDPSSGACIFQVAGVGCGLSHCTGSNESRGVCDGKGACGSPVSTPCPANLTCLADSSGCKVSCLTGTDCVSGAFCDVGGGTNGAAIGACCLDWVNNIVYVDNDFGSDGPCCGEGPQRAACATVTRAMGLVRERQLYGATIIAAPKAEVNGNTGGCTYWGDTTNGSVMSEPYPIQLGYGVTLYAAGVCFAPYLIGQTFTSNPTCGGAFTAFQIAPFPEEDGGISPDGGGPAIFPAPVTLRGATSLNTGPMRTPQLTIGTQPAIPAVVVGPWYDPNTGYGPLSMDVLCGSPPSFGNGVFGSPASAVLDTVVIWEGGGSPELPAVAYGNSTLYNPAVFVGPNSALTLGPGPVQINLNYDTLSPGALTNEWLDGIDCIGAPGAWANLQDFPDAGSPILTIAPISESQIVNQATANQAYVGLPAEMNLIHCNLNLSAGPTLGAAAIVNFTPSGCLFDTVGIVLGPTSSGFFSAFGIAESEQDAGFVFGSAALPGLIHCMGRDGIFIPGQQDSSGNPLPGPTLQIPGATIRYNDGAGIHLQTGTLLTANTQLLANNVGLEVDGATDSTGTGTFGGNEQVTLGAGTVLACNGSNNIYQTPSPYLSSMFAQTGSHTQPTNAGADLWDQNTNIVIDARGLGWTDYNAKGQTAVAACDPTCFEGVWPNVTKPPNAPGPCNCTCAGPGCPSKTFIVIPDDLDIVEWSGASVMVDGGNALPSGYCGNIGGP
jgi:hypothetical protein